MVKRENVNGSSSGIRKVLLVNYEYHGTTFTIGAGDEINHSRLTG